MDWIVECLPEWSSDGHAFGRERLVDLEEGGFRSLLRGAARTEDAQPESLHEVSFFWVDVLQVVEVLECTFVDYPWSTLDGLSCDGE